MDRDPAIAARHDLRAAVVHGQPPRTMRGGTLHQPLGRTQHRHYDQRTPYTITYVICSPAGCRPLLSILPEIGAHCQDVRRFEARKRERSETCERICTTKTRTRRLKRE